MHDTELRKTIGKRAKARRKELGLTLDYMAEKLDVNKSTIMRYEKGVIDNTKRLVIEGLATALHVTPEYLRGETDDYRSEVNDKRTLQIIDYMEKAKNALPLGIKAKDNEFAENLLLLLLAEYEEFAKSFTIACHRYAGEEDHEELALTIGFESADEFNAVSFLREIMHTANTFYEISELLRNYAHDPEVAQGRMKTLLKLYNL